MDFSLRKSFKSHGSYKHIRKISAGGGGGGADTDSSHEKLPILFDHDSMRAVDPSDDHNHSEVIVKIDDGDSMRDNSNKIWRESSYTFWKDEEENKNDANSSLGFDFVQRGQVMEDPPSKLIGQFLHKQKASGEIDRKSVV